MLVWFVWFLKNISGHKLFVAKENWGLIPRVQEQVNSAPCVHGLGPGKHYGGSLAGSFFSIKEHSLSLCINRCTRLALLKIKYQVTINPSSLITIMEKLKFDI
jgi:hypothetical protein